MSGNISEPLESLGGSSSVHVFLDGETDEDARDRPVPKMTTYKAKWSEALNDGGDRKPKKSRVRQPEELKFEKAKSKKDKEEKSARKSSSGSGRGPVSERRQGRKRPLYDLRPRAEEMSLPYGLLSSMVKKFGPFSKETDKYYEWSKQTLDALNPKNPFAFIFLRKQGVIHEHPKPHTDHVYMAVKIPVSSEVLESYKSIPYNIYYTPGKLLMVGCAGWRTASSVLLIAIRMALGKLALDTVKQRDVLTKVTTRAARNIDAANRYLEQVEEEMSPLL